MALVIVLRGVSVITGSADPTLWSLSSGGNGHYYQYVSTPTRWVDARQDALSRDLNGLPGYLATITSEEENSFLLSLMPADIIQAWTGGAEMGQEGHWIWADGPEAGLPFWSGDQNGAPVNGAFTEWRPGAPDDLITDDAFMLAGPLNGSPGTWNDGSVAWHSGYLVEYSGAA
ncbi:MAG TPA: hypothetical protein EYG57_11120 [Planctomycetes bacterium]|nr:hypothetical protein [Planctomycetota bacterium]